MLMSCWQRARDAGAGSGALHRAGGRSVAPPPVQMRPATEWMALPGEPPSDAPIVHLPPVNPPDSYSLTPHASSLAP